MYYDENYDYSLGQLIPTIIALVVAYVIAKAIAFFGLVTKRNYNNWAKFFATITGIAYAIYMLPHIKVKNEILVFLAPFVFASFVGFISWMFYWFAFGSVAKDDKDDSVDEN